MIGSEPQRPQLPWHDPLQFNKHVGGLQQLAPLLAGQHLKLVMRHRGHHGALALPGRNLAEHAEAIVTLGLVGVHLEIHQHRFHAVAPKGPH